jgi:hypothetical protein
MAGYSGTPLARKLGVRPGASLALLGARDGFSIDELPPGVEVRRRARPPGDVIVSYHTRRADLARRCPLLTRALVADGGLWVAWPKRASGVNGDTPRTSCVRWRCPPAWSTTRSAPSTTRSGLRLVLRKELRAGRAAAAD